ncbi:tellurite resistance TerB family protein [Shewanella cyperi]|uniref:TerB family tellurite resistance protein n=1 Tax=Shewanella cyperi TaxID=2814292 RepID=A0A974XKF1_9GAMM|nr:TerB family tellurite resistance protein [Shewanella cyperi]QSX29939.1 TerB family tellurite resistance protein [Shewanella cyperi]QSX40716.1 TerB family tellurite resistance protein [Shewanella cyperi]
MIAVLKNLLNAKWQQAGQPEEDIGLAAAVMLVEVVLADDELSQTESRLLPELLMELLEINETAANQLIVDAKLHHQNATSLFEFTDKLNHRFDLQQKQALLLAMWRLAFADGKLCRYEEQIIRKSADLLHLRHSEVIQLRNSVLAETGE